MGLRHQQIEIRESSDGSILSRTHYYQPREHFRPIIPDDDGASFEMWRENDDTVDNHQYYTHAVRKLGFEWVENRAVTPLEANGNVWHIQVAQRIPSMVFLIERIERAQDPKHIGGSPCDWGSHGGDHPQRVTTVDRYVDGSISTHIYLIQDRTYEMDHAFAEYLEIGRVNWDCLCEPLDGPERCPAHGLSR